MFNHQVVLVTGGGKGIGRGITDAMLDAGIRVAVVQRSPIDPYLEAHECILPIQADLSQEDSFQSVVEETVTRFGRLDCLVNNAGVMFERSLMEMRLEEWDSMMALNLRSPMFLSQAALPYLKKSPNASIINIGSVEGLMSNPLHAAYASSKAAIHGLTRALAVDLGPYGIRVNAIAPGWIRSELSDSYLQSQAQPETATQDLLKLHPVGRVGQPQDIGDVAVFLASERASFITGQVVVVDGGRTVQLPLPF